MNDTIIKKINKCEKCSHVWQQKRMKSHQCPKCQSSKWNEDENGNITQSKEVVLNE